MMQKTMTEKIMIRKLKMIQIMKRTRLISTSKITHSIATSKITFNFHFLTFAMILRRAFFFVEQQIRHEFQTYDIFFFYAREFDIFFCRATNTSRISNI